MKHPSDDSDTEFPSFASAPPIISTAGSEKHLHKRKGSERHHKHDRKGQRKHKEHKVICERSRSSSQADSKSTRAILEELDRDSHITVDTRGDPNLRIFNQSSRPGAPRFKRFRNNNRVIGLKDAFIDPRGRRDDPEIRLVYRTKSQAIRYTEIDWIDQSDGVEMVMPSTSISKDPGADDEEFIQIEDVTDKAAATHIPSNYDDDDDGQSERPDFRSLEGMAKPKTRSTEITVAPDRNSSAAAVVVELEARIQRDKHDVTAWMELANCQRTIASSTFASWNRRESKRTIIELQLAVYRRSLEENAQSSELVLGYLELCKEIMDSESLANEWEKRIEHATDPRVFMEHVVFCQGLTARRSVSWMIDVYARSVKRVIRCGVHQDTQMKTQVLVAAVELLHCLCLFLRDSGYLERAVATYQAVIEWYLLAPANVAESTYGHRMGLFEMFWDSGAKRIGHAGAKGWCFFASRNNESKQQLESVDTEEGWNTAAAMNSISVLQLDSSLLDRIDPFSVTILEDVAPFLVDMEWKESVAGAMVDRFLQFAGVVGPRTFVFTHDTLYDKDSLTLDDVSCTLPYGGSSELSGMFDPSLWTEGHRSFPFISMPCGLDSMDIPLPYKAYCLWTWPSSELFQEISYNSLELLALEDSRLPPHMKLQLCVVLLEWSFLESVEKGRSVAKRILGVYPTSLLLWNSFAKMLARFGHWEEARKVWSNSMTFAASVPGSEQPWSIVLRKSWAILEAMHGRGLGIATKIACAQTGDDFQMLVQDVPGGVGSEILAENVLRAQWLIAQSEHHRNACAHSEVRNAAVALLMWLAYAKSLDVRAADKVYDDIASDTNERLVMDICTVHFFHSNTSKIHRAQDFRRHVQPAVKKFPQNSVLWEMFLHSEARLRMSSRVHWTLESIKNRKKRHHPCLQLIISHVQMRLDKQAGAGNRISNPNIRKYLGHTTCEGTSTSPLIWMVAFLFEQKHGSPKRAKKILVAATQQCPWVNEFFVLAMGGKVSEVAFAEHEKDAPFYMACGIRITAGNGAIGHC